jgi:hypothetical protein
MAALAGNAFPISQRMTALQNNNDIYVIRATPERMRLNPREGHVRLDDRPPNHRALVGVLLPETMYPELVGEDEETKSARRDVINLQGDIAGEFYTISHLPYCMQLTFS